jgi:molybdenum cofactor guanylyltransferase
MPPLDRSTFAAVILCGGKSTRMGESKAWLPFGPQTMLQRTVGVVLSEVADIVVVAADAQELPPLPPRVTVVRDARPSRGPLEGISAGLESLQDHQIAFVTSCDVPRLQGSFIRYLAELIESYDVVVPRDGQYTHPLSAVYRCQTVLPAIRTLLAADQLRPVSLFSHVRTRYIDIEELRSVDPNLESLDNLNTPEDYERALREAGFPVRS